MKVLRHILGIKANPCIKDNTLMKVESIFSHDDN